MSAPDVLQRSLAGDTLAPVYLIAGAEHLLVIEAADAVRRRARELGVSERVVLDADARFDWDELARTGASGSLFATRRLIDVRLPSGRPGRDGSAALIDYCQHASPDNVLLITTADWSKAHETKWVKQVQQSGVFVPIWPLKREQLPAWVAARLRSRGVEAGRDVATLLAERCEGNLLAAAQEVDKLALLAAGQRIDLATLDSLVGDDSRHDVFSLVDAALAGDGSRALRIIAGLRAEGEQVPALTGWVINQLRTLERLAASSGSLDAAFRRERVWPARQAMYRRLLREADAGHWQACLAQAGRIDAASKGRGDGDPWRELERLMAAIAAPSQGLALLR